MEVRFLSDFFVYHINQRFISLKLHNKYYVKYNGLALFIRHLHPVSNYKYNEI